MGGHLANAQLSAFQKHPLILHGKDVLTGLIVISKHRELLHAGSTLMMANLNSKYHVIGAIRLVFFAGRMLQGLVSSQWVNCLNVVSHLEVFLTMLALTMLALSLLTGPYSTSNSSEDLYWCICLHGCQGCSSEGGSDLTSEAFISALKRFISRRGMRSQILSDNGTNFVGANNYLKEVYKFLAAKATQTKS